jgi:hypothetical protein
MNALIIPISIKMMIVTNNTKINLETTFCLKNKFRMMKYNPTIPNRVNEMYREEVACSTPNPDLPTVRINDEPNEKSSIERYNAFSWNNRVLMI